MPNDENPPNNVVEIAGHRANSRNDERALNVRMLAQEAHAAFYDKFRIVMDDEYNLSVAKVVGPSVLAPINDRAVVDNLIGLLMGRATPGLIKNDVFPTWRVLSASRGRILQREIKPLIFKSDTETPWAWQRLDFDPTEIEIPVLLTKLLQRTTPDQARSLVLWLGSLLDYSFPRQQYLYLHGGGNDGKGTLIAMLVKLLGSQGVAMMNVEAFKDSHSTTALEGARLVLFADENSASFMSKGRFKALTGDDTMSINPKGQPRRNIKLHCKVMVASNFAPHVYGGLADMRRIIPVELAKIPLTETSHTEGLAFIEQGSAIMQFCYAAFKAWRVDNPDTAMLPTAQEAMDEVQADSMQAEIDSTALSLLRFGPEYSVSAATLSAYLRPRFPGGSSALQPVYQAMKRQGARRSQVTVNNVRIWTWTGVGIIAPTS